MAGFKSRKFLIALFALLLVVLHDWLGLDFEIQEIVGIVSAAAAFVFGEAWVDKQKVQTDVQREVVFWRDLASTASDAYRDLMDRVSPPGVQVPEQPFTFSDFDPPTSMTRPPLTPGPSQES